MLIVYLPIRFYDGNVSYLQNLPKFNTPKINMMIPLRKAQNTA